jgi:Polyketide cyclase / dehydrase and lipid transport
MPKRTHVRVSGHVAVALPPEDAFRLFTARGEQTWAEGWDPQFLFDAPDDCVVGTVFETHGRARVTWVVTSSTPGEHIAYVHTIAGDRVGIVDVSLAPGTGGTDVTVTYDLTALSPAADDHVADFASHYPEFLRGWETAIARTVAGP